MPTRPRHCPTCSFEVRDFDGCGASCGLGLRFGGDRNGSFCAVSEVFPLGGKITNELYVSSPNSIPARKATGVVDVNVLYHALFRLRSNPPIKLAIFLASS